MHCCGAICAPRGAGLLLRIRRRAGRPVPSFVFRWSRRSTTCHQRHAQVKPRLIPQRKWLQLRRVVLGGRQVAIVLRPRLWLGLRRRAAQQILARVLALPSRLQARGRQEVRSGLGVATRRRRRRRARAKATKVVERAVLKTVRRVGRQLLPSPRGASARRC